MFTIETDTGSIKRGAKEIKCTDKATQDYICLPIADLKYLHRRCIAEKQCILW